MSWIKDFSSFQACGNEPEAIALLRREAACGNLAAKVCLAIEHRAAGLTIEEADKLVDEALLKVADTDHETHWFLSRALDLRFSSVAPEKKAFEGFKHLEISTKITRNPVDAFAVAVHYHYGAPGVAASKEMARKWYKVAADQGDESASKILKEL